jgi:outer membrane protein TolC
VAARRASLAAAHDGSNALANLHVPAFLVPELPLRRKQAALGVAAASAALDQAERETAYAVGRNWYTVLYAREQERIARAVVDRLTATQETAQRMLKGGARDVTAADADRALVYVGLARTRLIQAEQGVKRALASLNEAIGAGPGFCPEAPSDRLPEPEHSPRKEDVVALALARRGELAQANLFAQVAALEVEAQATRARPRMETFAAGSDIHATPVPQGLANNEYRPGAVPPEMPAVLIGSRAERVRHAHSLHARALVVVEATKNLIALEAQDAFLRWEEARRQARQARRAARSGDKLADDLSKDFTSGLRVRVEDVVNARVLASQARAQYNEYLYKQILALLDMERITAGAFSAGQIPSSPPPPARTGSDKPAELTRLRWAPVPRSAPTPRTGWAADREGAAGPPER